jgi:hypothetical protein
LEDPGIDGRIILKVYSGSGIGDRNGLIWLKIGPGGRLL